MANRTCIIHRAEELKGQFIKINKEKFIDIISKSDPICKDEESKNYKLQTKGEICLYIYLVGNKNGFAQGMNYENTGLDKSTYQRAFLSLEEKGYLVQRVDKPLIYDFYEVSRYEQDQEEKGGNTKTASIKREKGFIF